MREAIGRQGLADRRTTNTIAFMVVDNGTLPLKTAVLYRRKVDYGNTFQMSDRY